MNWLHFSCRVAGFYIIYYVALILLDLARHKRPATALSEELTFSEDIAPKAIPFVLDPAKETIKPGSPVIASGGVSLKNLFGLCRDEAVLYTKAVSF